MRIHTYIHTSLIPGKPNERIWGEQSTPPQTMPTYNSFREETARGITNEKVCKLTE